MKVINLLLFQPTVNYYFPHDTSVKIHLIILNLHIYINYELNIMWITECDENLCLSTIMQLSLLCFKFVERNI